MTVSAPRRVEEDDRELLGVLEAGRHVGEGEGAGWLAVVTACAYESMSLQQVDAVERPIIAKVNRSSCMGKERKHAALANLRNALRLCRSGVDPMAPESNQYQNNTKYNRKYNRKYNTGWCT